MTVRGKKKIRTGVVVRSSKDKSAMVTVERTKLHPMYKRVIRVWKKYLIHDEKNECVLGDVVEIMETRPLSKCKRWRLVNILEKAK